MKYACTLILIYGLLFCCNIFAECRNSETCGNPVNCVRCTDRSNSKANGEVTILSKSSQPIRIYSNANLRSCIPCSCGDGTHDEGEGCDDGNARSSDGCSEACVDEYCGDGYLNLPGEECDDGNTENTDACVCRCDGVCKQGEKPVGKDAKCGDGFVYSVSEQCDKGDLNGTVGSACSKTCVIDKCLDTPESVKLLCGNGTVECSEQCDDGNKIDGDACSATCENEKILCELNVCELTANVKGNQDTDLTLLGTERLKGTCTLAEVVPQAPQQSSPAISVTANETKTAWGQYSPWPDPLSQHLTCPAGTKKQNCKFEQGTGPLGKIKCGCTAPVTLQSQVDALCGNKKVDCDEQCDDGNKLDGDGCSSTCKVDNCVWIATSAAWSMHRKIDNIWDKEIASRTQVDEYEEVPGCFSNYYYSKCNMIWTDFYPMVEEILPDLKAELANIKASPDENDLIIKKILPRLKTELKTASAEKKVEIRKLIAMINVAVEHTKFSNFEAIPNDINTKGVTIFGRCAGHATAGAMRGFLGVPKGQAVNASTFYMDENCKYVSDTSLDNKSICGFAGVAWTPLSLILNEAKYKETSPKVVDFSLNLDPNQKYSVWKASASAPLVVYDPEKTGRVDSAAQLFGNWTFGGKGDGYFRTVSLKSSETRQAWKNGYEALSVLDADEDGKISGSELDVLSLWFDKNQNAVVDSEEMKDISEVGITTLYYKGVKQGDGSDLQLRLGYEREINGKVVSGRSVDWYGNSFSNMSEAINGLGAIFTKPKENLESPTALKSAIDFIPHEVKPELHSEDISGYWVWTLEGDRFANKPGMFVLEQNEDASISGYNIAEANLSENQGKLRSAIKVMPLTGRVSKSAEGLSLELEVKDPESGAIARSLVKLKGKGLLLEGVTAQKFVDKNSNQESVDVTYRWVAGRS